MRACLRKAISLRCVVESIIAILKANGILIALNKHFLKVAISNINGSSRASRLGSAVFFCEVIALLG